MARDIADARDALVAERDENTARKEMLPSEKAALGMAIEEMEKPAAQERMLAGVAPYPVVTGPQGAKSRDIAAEAVGMSEPSYRRVKQALVAADNEDEPEAVREVARDVLAQIDAGAPIAPQVERIKETRRVTESVMVEQISDAEGRSGFHAVLPLNFAGALPHRGFLLRLPWRGEGGADFISDNGSDCLSDCVCHASMISARPRRQ